MDDFQYLRGRLDVIEEKVDGIVLSVEFLVAEYNQRKGTHAFIWKAGTVLGSLAALILTWIGLRHR